MKWHVCLYLYVPLTGLEVANHVLVIVIESNKKNIPFEQNIFLLQDCTHSVLCHNDDDDDDNNNNNHERRKFGVGSHFLCNSFIL